MRPVLMLILLLLPLGMARAQQTRLAVGPNQNAEALGIDAETLRAEMEEAIDLALAVGDQQPFLQGMARALTPSLRGMGADYSADPERLVVGLGFGTALAATSVDPDTESLLPLGGVSSQASLMVGLPLSAVGATGLAADLTAYVHGGSLPMPGFGAFSARATTLGSHLQWRAVAPVGEAIRWGGLRITTGLVWARYRLRLEDRLAIEAPTEPIPVVWRTTGSYVVRAQQLAIPLELSTSGALGPLGIHVGGGLDVLPGIRAWSEAQLSGNLIATPPNSPEESHVGEAVLTIEDSARAPRLAPRVFFGPDLALGPVHLGAQVNLGVGTLGLLGSLRMAL